MNDRDSLLVATFERDHAQLSNGWAFELMWPEFFSYVRESDGMRVFFTPDFNETGVVDVQIVDVDGELSTIEPPSPSVAYTDPLTAEALLEIAMGAIAAIERATPCRGCGATWDQDYDACLKVLRQAKR